MELNNDTFASAASEASREYRANVLVCGLTGSGKTSLIYTMFGDQIVSRNAIGEALPTTMGFDEYPQRPGPCDVLRVFDSKGFEPGSSDGDALDCIRNFIQDNGRSIDVVWYTIQASGARVLAFDFLVINELKRLVGDNNVVVVVTKEDTIRETYAINSQDRNRRSRQRTAIQSKLQDGGVSPRNIVYTSDYDSGAVGCIDLLKLTCDQIKRKRGYSAELMQQIDRRAQFIALGVRGNDALGIINNLALKANNANLSDGITKLIAWLSGLYGLTIDVVALRVIPFAATVAARIADGTIQGYVREVRPDVKKDSANEAALITKAIGQYFDSECKNVVTCQINGLPRIVNGVPFTFSPEKLRPFL